MTKPFLELAIASCLVASVGFAQEQTASILAPGSALPPGFSALEAMGTPGREGQQIDMRFQDPSSNVTIRYTAARGSILDVELGESVRPIDVCIRDAATGEVLMDTVFADKPLIAGCGEDDDDGKHAPTDAPAQDPADTQRKRDAAAKGLEALREVRFTSQYEPEREALVAHLTAMHQMMQPPAGGRVIKEDESGRVVIFDTPPKAP
jgi:hypothetical protein